MHAFLHFCFHSAKPATKAGNPRPSPDSTSPGRPRRCPTSAALTAARSEPTEWQIPVHAKPLINATIDLYAERIDR